MNRYRYKKEIERRLMIFRGSKHYHLQDKTIILVDDGIATGATMFAAIRWLGNRYSSTARKGSCQFS